MAIMTDIVTVERKTFTILQVLANTSKPLGSIVIARELKDLGVDLGERAVRYHLKVTDEHGLTRLAGRRDGRAITDLGLKELKQGMVKEKVGFAISRIELLAFLTTFNVNNRTGLVPVNVSVIRKQDFQKALQFMRPVFSARLCASSLVCKARGGEKIGDFTVPEGMVALATVCSVLVNGALLKAGVPMNSRFGGLLQIRDRKPLRFVDLIHYSGCSLDPAEVFIKAKMTSVTGAVKSGNGSILANFREIPALCRPIAQEVITKLGKAGLNSVFLVGGVSEPVCETPMELNRVGMVLIGGLNPIAAVQEAGIEVDSHAMSTVIDYRNFIEFEELLK
jgi:HTH-type transcriptional regulator, global nitrogen regulator NrpRI